MLFSHHFYFNLAHIYCWEIIFFVIWKCHIRLIRKYSLTSGQGLRCCEKTSLLLWSTLPVSYLPIWVCLSANYWGKQWTNVVPTSETSAQRWFSAGTSLANYWTLPSLSSLPDIGKTGAITRWRIWGSPDAKPGGCKCSAGIRDP